MAEDRKINKAGEPEQSGIPRHIAIILDGNGRWAKKRGLPRTAGRKISGGSPPTAGISAWSI